MAKWGNRRPVSQQSEIITLGDGINTYDTVYSISRSEAMDSRNTSSHNYPALSVRKGVSYVWDTGSNIITTPNGLGVRDGSEPHIVDGTTWKKWNGASLDTLATGLTNAKATIVELSDLNGDKYTCLFNGTERKSYNGTTVADLTEAPQTNLVTVDDYRLFALEDSLLKNSAIYSVSDWTTAEDATTIPVAGMLGSGTAITAFQGSKICWSDKSMHILYGDNYNNFEFVDPIRAGCMGQRATTQSNGVLYFMDYYKIKSFTGGMPRDISQKVKTYLDGVNYTYKNLICAGSDDRYVYFSIPYGAVSANNVTLQYDTERKTWYPWTKGYVAFVNIGEVLYGITTAGKAEQMNSGTSDGGSAISWYHTTGVFTPTPIRNKKTLSNLFLEIDLPVASSMTVSYATDADGASFTTLYTFTGNANEQRVRVQVPTATLQRQERYRLKFAGSGPATVHFVEVEERIGVR